jgi:hypothetical protein
MQNHRPLRDGRRIGHLEELASKPHQARNSTSTRATTLTLHVHLQGHLSSLLDSRLLARTRSHVACGRLAVEELARLAHGHSNKGVLGIASRRTSTAAAAERLESCEIS